MIFNEVLIFILVFLGVIDAAVWIYAYLSVKKSIAYLGKQRLCRETNYSENFSVIIPTRNDEKTIGETLKSLMNQDVKPREIIIVDDGSSDSTPKIIAWFKEQYKIIKYIRIDQLPKGWAPKVYALYRGVSEAKSDLLIFLDADVELQKNCLRSLLCYADKGGIASLMPRFICNTVICRSLETVLTTFSHAFLGFHRVFNSGDALAWFYGCCWGIRRDYLRILGAFESVKGELVEDKALAKIAKKKGVPINVIDGSGCSSTVWYGTLKENLSALTRILHSFGSNPFKSLPASLLIFIGYYYPLISILAGMALIDQHLIELGVLTYLITSFSHIIGARINRYPIYYIFTYLATAFTLPLSLIKALKSRKIVEWRDRSLKLGEGSHEELLHNQL